MKIRRRITLDILMVMLVFVATTVAASAAEFTTTGNPRELKGAPGIYEWTFSAVVGKSPYDKIALHRLAKQYGVRYVIAGHLHQLLRFELDGVTESVARESLRLAADKLPVRTKFISRHHVAAA